MWVRIWKSSVKWGLRYASYDAELIERTKKLSRIFWSPRHRAWIVPDEQSIYEMMEILKGEGVSIFTVVKENELLGFWMQKNLVKATTKHNIKGESKKQALVDAMRAHGYSAKTIRANVGHVNRYKAYLNQGGQVRNDQCLQEYALHLLSRFCTHSYVNQAISAISLLQKEVWKMDLAERGRRKGGGKRPVRPRGRQVSYIPANLYRYPRSYHTMS